MIDEFDYPRPPRPPWTFEEYMLTIRCPTCKAAIGVPCVTTRKRYPWHVSRQDRAVRLENTDRVALIDAWDAVR